MLTDIEKKLVSTAEITNNLTQRLYKNRVLDVTILEIDYMNKKFTIERKFKNNLAGRDELNSAIQEFDSEAKVKSHFGLK